MEGQVPLNPNFTVTSGTFDLEAINTGGTDTENDIPFDILTSATQLSGLAYNSSTRVLSWTKATDARSYAWRIGSTGDWTDIGDVSSYTFSAANAPAAGSTIYLRVNQPWIGDALSYFIIVSPVISAISNINKNTGYSQFTYQASASGTAPITWSINGSGASISSSGLITINAGLSSGIYNYTVTASNAGGSDTETFTLYISGVPGVVQTLIWEVVLDWRRARWVVPSGYPAISYTYIEYRWKHYPLGLLYTGSDSWSGTPGNSQISGSLVRDNTFQSGGYLEIRIRYKNSVGFGSWSSWFRWTKP